MSFIQSATVLPEQRQQVPLSWLIRNFCNGQVLVYDDGVQRTARPTVATCFLMELIWHLGVETEFNHGFHG